MSGGIYRDAGQRENVGGKSLGDLSESPNPIPSAGILDFEMLSEVRRMLSDMSTSLIRQGVSSEAPMWHGACMIRCDDAAEQIARAVGALADYLNDEDAEAALVAWGIRG